MVAVVVQLRPGYALAIAAVAVLAVSACGGDESGGLGGGGLAAGSGGTPLGGGGGSPDGGTAGHGGTGGSGPTQATCEVLTDAPEAVAAPVLRATFPGSWDENWFGSPAIFDLDDDGDLEIAAGRHSVLYVHEADGTPMWRAAWGENGTQSEVHGSDRTYPSVAAGDFDGDGLGEIAGVSGDGLYVYAHDGQLVREWHYGDGELRTLAMANLDNEGPMEALTMTTVGAQVVVVFDYDGGVRATWPPSSQNDCGAFNQNIGAGNLTGDQSLEVVATVDCCYFGVYFEDGSDIPIDDSYSAAGTTFADIPLFHDLALAQQGWGGDGNDRDEVTDSPPVIVDLDDDGASEIVLMSDHERAGEYINRGNSFWVFEADATRASGWEWPKTTGEPLFTGYEDNIVQVAPAVAVADFDERPGKEMIGPSYDGRLYAYSAQGEPLFSYAFDDGSGPFIGASEPLIVDLNRDGRPEILFATYSTATDVSQLVILDGTGTLLHAVPISGRGTMAPPSVADVDGDDELEIVLSLKDALGSGLGGIQIWDVPGSSTNCLLWPTGRSSYLRTGAPE